MVNATEVIGTTSAVRKIIPQLKLPPSAVRQTMSSDDLRCLKRVIKMPCECQFDPMFQEPDAESVLMGALPDPAPPRKPRRSSDDSGADLLFSQPITLTNQRERMLFLRLNYCRYRVMRVLRQYRDKRLTVAAARELLEWERHTLMTRSEIVSANVPLVLAMAKRTRVNSVDFADLISEGNMALLRAVDKFDCARGYKFSTYACRAILKSFSRAAVRAARYRGHFPTEFDPALEKSNQMDRKRDDLETDCVDELKSILGRNSANLNDIERQVLVARFALDEIQTKEPRPKTLEQVGEMIGVTKERVRQIQNKALGKLRSALETDTLVA